MKTAFRFLLVVFWLITVVNPLQAQWVNTGATNTTVNALAVSPASGGSGTNLFAGIDIGVPTIYDGVW